MKSVLLLFFCTLLLSASKPTLALEADPYRPWVWFNLRFMDKISLSRGAELIPLSLSCRGFGTLQSYYLHTGHQEYFVKVRSTGFGKFALAVDAARYQYQVLESLGFISAIENTGVTLVFPVHETSVVNRVNGWDFETVVFPFVHGRTLSDMAGGCLDEAGRVQKELGNLEKAFELFGLLIAIIHDRSVVRFSPFEFFVRFRFPDISLTNLMFVEGEERLYFVDSSDFFPLTSQGFPGSGLQWDGSVADLLGREFSGLNIDGYESARFDDLVRKMASSFAIGYRSLSSCKSCLDPCQLERELWAAAEGAAVSEVDW